MTKTSSLNLPAATPDPRKASAINKTVVFDASATRHYHCDGGI